MNPSQTGTFGVFRSDITKMRIGDYTCAMYALDTTDDPLTADQREAINTRNGKGRFYYYLGKFSQLGTADQNTPEFTLMGNNIDSLVTNGLVWLVKVKKGVLMPTCSLGRGNYAAMGYYFGLINGRKITIDGRDFIMQLPSVDDYQALISDMGSNTKEALKKLIEEGLNGDLTRNYYRYPEQAEGVYVSTASPAYTSTIPIEITKFGIEDSYNQNLDVGYVAGNNGLTTHLSEKNASDINGYDYFRLVLKYVDDPRCQSIYV